MPSFINAGNSFSKQFMPPQRDLYNRKDTRIEYQLYSQDYFSGADMHIYFGDIWIDEITNLEFSLKEEVLPIYGYSSYTYDHLARGRRQITGAFSMNFKSVGYLKQVLHHADAIEYVLQEGKKKAPPNIQFYDKYKLDEILKMYGKESFEQIAEEYERAIWGENEEDDESFLNSPYAPYFQPNSPYGFDIRINYGAVQETYSNHGFYSSSSSNASQPNLTVEVLNGVQLNGMQKQAGTSNQGAPVQEIYTFIAQDLNGTSIKP